MAQRVQALLEREVMRVMGRPGAVSLPLFNLPCIWEGAWRKQGPEREAACSTLKPSQASLPPLAA